MPVDHAQRLTYPISPEYVKGWTAERALAELVSNAYDEDADFTFEWKDGVLTIEDQGPGIPEEGMVLGISRKSNRQIGVHGEGKKIAALVLTRSKNVGEVRFETVGYGFVPTITRAPIVNVATFNGSKGKTELLAYDFFECTRKRGTKITIECDKKLADAVRARFLLFDKGYKQPLAPGAIVKGGRPGRIYLGGVVVQERKGLLLSYNISLASGKTLINRDRTIIENYELDRLIQEILLEVKDPDVLEPLVRAALAGKLAKAERAFNTYGADPGYRKAMKEVAKRLFGDEPVCYQAQSWGHDNHEQEAALDLKDRSYRVLEPTIDYHEFVQLMRLLGVRSAGELYKKPKLRKHAKQKTDWVELGTLSESERANLERAVATVRALYGEQAVDQYGVYSRTSLEEADVDLHWGGFYQPSGGKIGLHRDNLQSFEATLEVLIHEAGHRLRHRERRYDYGDRSRGFESQLVKMAMLAAAKLSEAGLLPTTLEEQKAQEAERPKDPAELACALVRERMQASGLSSYAKLSDASGVTQHVAGTIAKGEGHGYRMSPKPKNVRAVCEALELDWLPIWLAVSATNLFQSYSRRKNGWLYGQAYPECLEAVAALKERGQEDLAELVLAHAQGTQPTTKDDSSWLQPYRELVEVEVARVSALNG